MANTFLSIVTGAIPTATGILGTGHASVSPATAIGSSIPLSIPTGSLVSTLVPTIVASALSAAGTTLLRSTPLLLSTPATPTTLISSSPTSIPKTSKTSSVFSNNLNNPTTSTSAPLFESTSNSVSLTESLNITTIVTIISGSPTTITSLLPTTLVNSPSDDVVSRRTAVIAGATIGFIALVLIALGAVFFYRRHELRKDLESSGQKREGRGLLDGEEFDDDDKNISTSMRSYPYPTHVSNPEAVFTVKL